MMKSRQSDIRLADTDTILYELIINSEWSRSQSLRDVTTFRHQQTRQSLLTRLTSVLPPHVTRFKFDYHLDCKLAIGQTTTGVTLVAIARESELEVRTSHDQFASVISRCSLPTDEHPERRHLTWSPDCSMIALSYSNGLIDVFDILGAKLFSMLTSTADNEQISSAIVKMIFLEIPPQEAANQDLDWNYKLVAINYRAEIFSYYVSAALAECQEIFSKPLVDQKYSSGFPSAITDVGYTKTHPNLIFLASCPLMSGGEAPLKCGLSVWRFLHEQPFIKLVTGTIEEELALMKPNYVHRLTRFLTSFINNLEDWPLKISMSPNGRRLAVVYSSGKLEVRDLPALRMVKKFYLAEQINDVVVDLDKKKKIFKFFKIPEDDWLKIAEISWWNDQALVVVRVCGALTILSIDSLANLLGKSSEVFDGPLPPSLTSPLNERFSCIERDVKIMKAPRRIVSDGETEEDRSDDEEELDDDDLPDDGWLSSTVKWVKETVYSVSGIEWLSVPKSNIRFLQEHFRLVEFRKTTVEELFNRYLERNEFGEALDLARAYGLDTDIIYQKQWKQSTISSATIQDYLGKVTKRNWVINECLDCVPSSVDATRALIQFGLKMTDLETIISIENDDPDDLLKTLDDDDEDIPVVRGDQYKSFMKKKAKQIELKMITMIDFDNLSSESRQICSWRKKLLTYLDRLTTYERIISDCHQHFDADYFRQFRDWSGFEAAVQMARSANWRGVDIVMMYHARDTRRHRLTILSNFPETISPKEYNYILPYCKRRGDVLEVADIEEVRLREEDWSEIHCKFSNEESDDFEAEYYLDNQNQLKYKVDDLTPELVTEWFEERACQIESMTSIVNNSLQLIREAIDKNVPNLDRLFDDLKTFSIMVYDVGQIHLDFDQFQQLSEFQKVKLLMTNATKSGEQFLIDIKRYLIPFIEVSAKYNDNGTDLFREYLSHIAATDLSLCLKVFQDSKVTNLKVKSVDKIINNVYDLISYAIECVYACEDVEQLDNAFAIVECLPQRTETVEDDRLNQLNDEVDLLEKHLIVADILDQKQSPESPAKIRDLQLSGDRENTRQLFMRITRTAGRKQPPLLVNDWIELFRDLEEIHQMVFSELIDEDEIRETFVQSLLTSGRKENFGLAATYMQLDGEETRKKKKKLIDFKKSVQLIVEAVREYINSSDSVLDVGISMAKECLNLVDQQERIKNLELAEEVDFIEALYLIHGDFPIKMLPIQIRLCQPRIEIIKKAAKSTSKAYKKTTNLIKLSQLLRVEHEEEVRRTKVLSVIAETALQNSDFTHCYKTCQLIMNDQLPGGWLVCRKLAEEPRFSNDLAKIELLSFSMAFCDDEFGDQLEEMVFQVLAIKKRIKYKNLY